ITKFRKKNISADEYKQQLKQYNNIRLQLFKELNDGILVEEVEKILKDCEDLINLELELKGRKDRLSGNILLLEGNGQMIPQQIDFPIESLKKELLLKFSKKKVESEHKIEELKEEVIETKINKQSSKTTNEKNEISIAPI